MALKTNWLQFALPVTMMASMAVTVGALGEWQATADIPASPVIDRAEVAPEAESAYGRSHGCRSMSRSEARAIVRASPEWRDVRVYYDPRNPRATPLRPGASEMPMATAFVMIAPALLVSLGGFIWLIREYRRSRLTN